MYYFDEEERVETPKGEPAEGETQEAPEGEEAPEE